jgi:hypothetical protein
VTTKVWDKVQNVCYRLNYEAYKQTKYWSWQARHSTYTPCDKARYLIDQCDKGLPLSLPEMMVEAYNTPCYCHHDMWIPFFDFQLWALDETYRMAHYAGMSPEKWKAKQEKENEVA